MFNSIKNISLLAFVFLLLGFSKAENLNVVYLGDQINNTNIEYQSNYQKNGISFSEIKIEGQEIFKEDEIKSEINKNILNIKNSNMIILNSKNFEIILQTLSLLNSNNELNLSNKDIFITEVANKAFIKRIISKYINNLNINKILTLNTEYLPVLLANLTLNQDLKGQPYITKTSLSFNGMPRYYPISYMVDYLISEGFPINLISLMLLLCAATLLISIFRQIIGLSVFEVFNPLLFAASLYVLGTQTTLLLLGVACISMLLVNLINKKIFLLHSAKISIMITLSFILTIIVVRLDSTYQTNLISFDIFKNGYIIFPILFIIFITDNIFQGGFRFLNRNRRKSIAEFTIITLSVYLLMNWVDFKHLLLSYPELIIVIFFAIIIVGRYTGLQLTEYIRFMPLVKKYLEGEEEE